MHSTDLDNVEPRSWRADTFTLDIELAKPNEENIFASDYYEILRVGPQADEDTIERVYRTLADRFHPDNPRTGDPETFLRLGEAYQTLSNPAKRAEYNVLRQSTKSLARFGLRGREFFDGVKGAQNRRLAVLCLLYRKRISTHESPGLTILDLERLTGCTREELTSALWYLCEKKWSTIGDFTAYSITADGFDFVERKLEDRLEFRALATLSYYDLPAEPEDPAHVEFRFWINDALSLDLEPARTIEGAASIADYYEILGIGPQADEETIERVYLTLAGRFHPDSPGTADADTFLRITEAYETLSDQAKRAQYDALRERTKDSTRFRLRGREFFDGIRGEQLRRLAVLCLLYRQAATESSGLTTLDLEQLTGCTREELGSALWYLREKKWAKSGEFTEYSITAVGFDVVENKVEDREAARSKAWLNPEDAQGKEFVYTQVNAAQPAALSQQGVPVALLSPISNTIALEDQNSHRIAESEPTEITAEVLSDENVGVAQGPIPIEQATGPAEQVARFELDAEPAALSEQNVPVTPLSPISDTIATENQYSLGIEESERTDIKAEEPSDENVEPAQGPIPIEDAPGLAEQVTRFEVDAEPVALREQDVPVMLLSPISDTIAPENQYSHWIAESEQTDIKTEEPSENVEVAQVPIPIEDAPVPAEEITQFEDGSEPEEREATRSWAWLDPEDTYGEFVYPYQASAAQPAEPSQQNVTVMPEFPTSSIITPEKQNSLRIAESEQTNVKAEERSDQQPAVAPGPTQIEDAPNAAQPTSQSQANSHMNDSTKAIAEQAGGVAVSAVKRVILSMGGKGGVGKTSVMTGLAEWFEENRIPATLLDLDTENKAKGSLNHFFGRAPKINIHTPAGLDAFIDHLDDDAPVILADMGAGAGKITHDWFDKMYPDVTDVGIVFTAIGVVTSDPASVDSVLTWAAALQDRVAYVIVENKLTEHADFAYWRENDQAEEFRKRFQPAVIRLDCRLADLENAVRNYGVTLGRVASRTAPGAELQKASLVMRAQSYRRRMFAEFDKVKELLLP